MRTLTLPFVISLLVAACGSSSQVTTAKTARYQGERQALFAAVKTLVELKYTLAQSDETSLTFQTAARWYTPDGLISSASGDAIRELPDKSINVTFVVKLVPDADKWRVEVTPQMLRYNKGTPVPEKVSAGDASLPGWASGKIDQLAVDIHGALGKYEVKEVVPPSSGGGVDPGPAGPSSGW